MAATTTTESGVATKHVAVETWSVIARFLHEGTGIVTLHKAWDSELRDFLIFPWYAGQDPDAIKPAVWMVLRHELKAPLGGHAYIRDFAQVVDALPIQSAGALDLIDSEHGLTTIDTLRRYEAGRPGLVALILRVYHLTRSYKYYNIASLEKEGDLIPIPFDVSLEDLTPAVPDDEFERRRRRILKSLGRG
ncbi:MAG TPA: DUF1802 family protein [Vicinamibacteria bacterium]